MRTRCVTIGEEPRHMSHPRIKRDPKVMMGKPVIAGTRITVEHILLLRDNLDETGATIWVRRGGRVD
jgi:uncharacterized protein (DUF433 family)